MKDVIIRGMLVPAKRARWAFAASAMALISWVGGLCVTIGLRDNFSIERHFLASYLLIAARVFALSMVVIIAPRVVLPLTLLLAPFVTAMFAMEHEPWTGWWFWPATVLCEVAGGYAMLRISKKTPNKALATGVADL